MQVVQHPHNNIALLRGLEVCFRGRRPSKVLDDFVSFFTGDDLSLMKNIDELVCFVAACVFDHEMAWERNSLEFLEADAMTQFDEQNRQGNRQAFTFVQNFVEVAIGAIVIIAPTSMKAILDKQVLLQGGETSVVVSFGFELAPKFSGHVIQLPSISVDIQFRVVEFRNQESGMEEVDPFFRAAQHLEQLPLDSLPADSPAQAAKLGGLLL